MTKKRDHLIREAFENLGCAFRSVKHSRFYYFAPFVRGPHMELISQLLESKDGVSISEIAEKMHVTSGAVTHFTGHLAERGLIKRVEDKKDRRVVRIELTKDARDQIAKIRAHHLDRIGSIFSQLSDKELAQLSTLLTKISIKDDYFNHKEKSWTKPRTRPSRSSRPSKE